MQVQEGGRSQYIVNLLGYAEQDMSYLLFLELCPLGDLLNLVLDGGVDQRLARRLFSQLLSAVAHCHGRGVAHRDIKLDNILMAGSGDLRLCDLGLAARTAFGASECFCTDYAGTKYYTAPEVYRANVSYDAFLSDVWSCGVCLFTMQTVMFPFDEADPAPEDGQVDWRLELLQRCEQTVRVPHL